MTKSKKDETNFFSGVALFMCALLFIVTISLAFMLQTGRLVYKENVGLGKVSDVNLEEGAHLKDGYDYVFSEEIQQRFDELWATHPNSEYHLCLDGEVRVNRSGPDWTNGTSHVIIDTIIREVEGEMNYVSFPKCEGKATAHNHPSGPCRYSMGTGDANSAKGFFERGGLLFMIQCSENNFEMYTRTDIFNSEIVRID
jgi:hypothetical protein